MRRVGSIRWLLMLALAENVRAQTVPARRLVEESPAEYAKASPLALTAVQQWCVAARDAGCDFKNPASIRVTPNGGLLIADAVGPLRLFDQHGTLLRELGRKGKGPGEYGFVIDAQVTSDGMVTWFDNMQMRFTSVRMDGRAGPIRRLMPPHTMTDLFVVDTQLVVLDVPPHAVKGTMVDGIYRTVPVTGKPRVIARVRTPSVFAPGSDMMAPPGPFAARVLSDVSRRLDVAHSNGDRAEIDVFPARGAPWRLALRLPARPVTKSERDSAIAAALNRFKVKQPSELPAPLRAAYGNVSTTHAPLQQLRLLQDGTLWIKPTSPAGDSLARWDVFSFDGFRVGYVLLPRSARVADGARDWILVADLDADDLPTFTRYRVGGVTRATRTTR